MTIIKAMINEYICYKCKCEKCDKNWITKTHEVPKVCPKCHSVKWNEGCPPAPDPETIEIPQPVQPIADERKSVLNALQAKIDAIQDHNIVPEPQNEWTGWTPERQTYDDVTGEMRTYRKHIKTGRTKWIDSEPYFG